MKDYTYAVIDIVQSEIIKDNYFHIRSCKKELTDDLFKNEFGLNCIRKINYITRKINKDTFVVMIGDHFLYSRFHGDLWCKHKRDKEYQLYCSTQYSVPFELLDFDNTIETWLYNICQFEMQEEMVLLGWTKEKAKQTNGDEE